MTQNTNNNSPQEVSVSKFEDIVKKGDTIGVKINPESEWITDVVEDVLYESTIAITLLEEFISQDIMVDDAIECRVIKDNIVYIMQGTVNDVGIIYPQKVMLQIVSIRGYGNARDSKRYTVNLCGRIIYNNHESSAFATIKNISRTGVSVTCRDLINIGEEVDVDIVLWKQEVLAIEGKIVRMYKVGKNYRYGVLFESLDKRSKELLEEFIGELEELEKDEKKFLKK